ncbi:hypothetical protein MXB_3945 [Myxobolus squamalis]|nr:hypothetical protein MXB_3945 [Myxobolus squamalis]
MSQSTTIILQLKLTIKCMLSVHILNNMLRMGLSVGEKLIESEYFENPIKNFSLNNPSFVFGYYPHFDLSIKGVDKNNRSRNFVGKIGKIHILENFSSLDHFWNPGLLQNESNQKFDHITLNSRFQKSKLICFAPGIDHRNGSVYHHKSVHFNYYFDNYGGALIWLVFLDSLILNKTCDFNAYEVHEKEIIEQLSMCYLNLTTNYISKTRFLTSDLTLVIHIYHYFLYLHRRCSLIMTQNVIEFFNNNIDLSIKLSNSSTFSPFYYLLISPIIWSDFPFETQTLRMEIICEINENSIGTNNIFPIPIDNMLCYIDQVNNSLLSPAHKKEIFISIFNIFFHILVNSITIESLQSFYNYFINQGVSSSFDIMTLDLIFKFSNEKSMLKSTEILLMSCLISKIMLHSTHLNLKIISRVFIDFLHCPVFDQLFPGDVIIGWFCLLIMDNSCLDLDIYFLVDAIFTFFLNSKFDCSNSENWNVKLLIWSFTLTQRISLKHRISLITKFFKLLEKTKMIKFRIVSVNFVDIILTTLLLKEIPVLFLSSLKQDFQYHKLSVSEENKQKCSSSSCEFDSDKFNDIFKATTVIQQIVSVFLTIYLHHQKPFEFLMFPIFISEIFGSSSMFFDCWCVKISIIYSYLRHFYHLDSEKTNMTHESIHIDIFRCLNLCKPTLFHICSVISLLYRAYHNSKIEKLTEKILIFTIERIVKNYCSLFQNAGIGSQKFSSSTSCDAETAINNIAVDNNGDTLNFDARTWKQVLAWSDEHPLIICWLSNPSLLCESLRKLIRSQVVSSSVCIKKPNNSQTKCYLMFLGEFFQGKLFVEHEQIFFQETVSHIQQALFNINIAIFYKEMKKIYHSTSSNLHWTLEIFTKYSSSFYFEFSDKHSLDLVVKNIASSQNSVFIYSHMYSNEDISKKHIVSSPNLSRSNAIYTNTNDKSSILNDQLKFSKINITHSQQFENILPGSILCVSKHTSNNSYHDYFVNIMTEKHVFRYNLCYKTKSLNLYKMLSYMFTPTPSSYSLIRLLDIKIDYDISNIFQNSIKPFRASNIFVQNKDSSILVIGGFIDNIILVYSSQDLIAILNYHRDIVTCVDVYDEDGIVISGSKDGVCCLWYLKIDSIASYHQSPTIIFKPSYIFFGHCAPLVSISHSNVTKSIASYDSDHILCIHSLKSGLLSHKFNLKYYFLMNVGLSTICYTSSGFIISILSFQVYIL